MNKKCKNCSAQFEVTDGDLGFYKKMSVPVPLLCPDCRSNLRMSHRNFHSLYVRKSDMSGETVVSMFPSKSPFTVYSSEEWHGDKWDPLSYGRKFDFGKGFFEQYRELQLKVPRAALLQYLCENSNYCNLAYLSKSCYMVFGCVENEDCYYGHIVWRSKDCADGLYLYECELCYECVDCVGCYNCNYSQECRNSRDLDFCFDCLGCSNCFGCEGLRQKKYHWWGKDVGKEDYFKRITEFRKSFNGDSSTGVKFLKAERAKLVHPHYYGYQNENVSGDHIYYSKNTHYSFDAKRCEDCKFLFTAQRFTDVYDASFCAGDCELSYNCLTIASSQNLICCQRCQESYGLVYCDECTTCKDCFGCIGLKHKQYCILNKQYSKEEYESLKLRIVEDMTSRGEYGEFFPKEVSPYKYEESVAYMYNPKYLEMINCRNCKNSFEVSENIRRFLVDKKIPLPTLCVDCREQRRISFRNEKHFYRNKCSLCEKDIISVYSPEGGYKAMCSDCWWSDKLDATDIGRGFDFSKPFFEQFGELMKEANMLYLFGTRNVNSEYVNQETDDKNCYYNAGGHYNEDCFYNTYSLWGKDSVDCYWIIKSELLYECIQCERCFDCNFCQDCEGCSNCDFCKECLSCKNCFGCYGLRHKEFQIFNKQVSREEYEKFIKENRANYASNFEKQKEIFDHFAKFPQPFAHYKRAEDSTGDYLINTKNTVNAFLSENTWDCENVFVGFDVKNSYDLSSFGWGELLYEVASSLTDYDCQFCSQTIDVKFAQYCYMCQNSQNLFGCAGVKNGNHMIFNKQYSKEEYEALKSRIVEHMVKTGEYGEFFPMNLSPFKYSDTVASEYFPKM